MKLTLQYWAKQAGLGLVVTGLIALLGHLNYAQFRLVGGMTVADWYFVACWLCFPFAKWVLLEDNRQVSAPTVHRRKKRRAADATASVYERADRRATEHVKAAPKTPLKWYWLLGVDILLGFLAPVILGGFVTYSLKHN